jgi:hypothetical protein
MIMGEDVRDRRRSTRTSAIHVMHRTVTLAYVTLG